MLSEVTGVTPPNATYYKDADTLRQIMSTYETEMQITQAVLDQAEADAPKSGYDTSMFYTVPLDDNGKIKLVTADGEEVTVDNNDPNAGTDASYVVAHPVKDGYENYHEDAIPPNGAPFTSGISFPLQPVNGQFCLRTDYFPKRLFRYDGKRWVKYEDNVRMTMSNNGSESSEPRLNQRGTFINNTKVNTIDGKQVPEKQSLSKALRPKADE